MGKPKLSDHRVWIVGDAEKAIALHALDQERDFAHSRSLSEEAGISNWVKAAAIGSPIACAAGLAAFGLVGLAAGAGWGAISLGKAFASALQSARELHLCEYADATAQELEARKPDGSGRIKLALHSDVGPALAPLVAGAISMHRLAKLAKQAKAPKIKPNP